MKPDDAVDQQRRECAGHGVGARLDRLLIDAVMRIGRQRTALAGLEIHHVVADRAALQRQRRVARLAQQRERHAEAGVGRLGAADRLEHEIDRRAALDRAQAGGDVRQHAGLRRDGVALAHLVEHREQRARGIDAVGRRIDADHRIARAEQQAVEHGCGDAARIVGRMVGLQAHREPPGQADRVAEARDDAALRRHRDQVLKAHQLADRGRHLRREAGRSAASVVRFGGEQQLAELADGERGHRRERRRVVGVDDQPGDFVGFVGNDRLGEDRRQRHIGQRHLRRDAFRRGCRREPRERVARPDRRRPRQQRAQVVERCSACRRACARRSSGIPAGILRPSRGDPEDGPVPERNCEPVHCARGVTAAVWPRSEGRRDRCTSPQPGSAGRHVHATAPPERATAQPVTAVALADRCMDAAPGPADRRRPALVRSSRRTRRISGGRPVAERRGQAPPYPLTADLAGVLATAQRERAPAHGLDGASRGVGQRCCASR